MNEHLINKSLSELTEKDIDKMWIAWQKLWYFQNIVHNPNYIDWDIGKNHDKHQRHKINKRRRKK